MFRFIPARMKVWCPGYRPRMYRRHRALIDLIRASAPKLEFGTTDDVPWLHLPDENLRLFGFATEPSNAELFEILRPALPPSLKREHFRLAKDYVTRWIYPHMRPDLAPEGYAIDELYGLHGQHKDSIRNLADPAVRDRLMRAFRPGRDDVVIDCGAFLGFGAIRMARDAPGGRVFAVEASGDCYARLERNVEVNGLTNVRPLHRGVWSSESEINLGKSYAQANSLVTEVHAGESIESIKTVSIDGLVRTYGLERLDMLSMTMNGAEVEALQGAADTLSRLRPRIRAAGWYKRGERHIAAILREALGPYDYDVFIGPRNNFMALPRERA